jgi:hypothetical protein
VAATMKYKVWVRSVPGFYEQYDGYLDVVADTYDEAIDLAFKKLKRGAFSDRSRSMWKVEKVEVEP